MSVSSQPSTALFFFFLFKIEFMRVFSTQPYWQFFLVLTQGIAMKDCTRLRILSVDSHLPAFFFLFLFFLSFPLASPGCHHFLCFSVDLEGAALILFEQSGVPSLFLVYLCCEQLISVSIDTLYFGCVERLIETCSVSYPTTRGFGSDWEEDLRRQTVQCLSFH